MKSKFCNHCSSNQKIEGACKWKGSQVEAVIIAVGALSLKVVVDLQSPIFYSRFPSANLSLDT